MWRIVEETGFRVPQDLGLPHLNAQPTPPGPWPWPTKEGQLCLEAVSSSPSGATQQRGPRPCPVAPAWTAVSGTRTACTGPSLSYRARGQGEGSGPCGQGRVCLGASYLCASVWGVHPPDLCPLLPACLLVTLPLPVFFPPSISLLLPTCPTSSAVGR